MVFVICMIVYIDFAIRSAMFEEDYLSPLLGGCLYICDNALSYLCIPGAAVLIMQIFPQWPGGYLSNQICT